jgi:hypothetical protein
VRLTTSPPSGTECHEILEPKTPGTLWATPGLLQDSFTFTLIVSSVEKVPECYYLCLKFHYILCRDILVLELVFLIYSHLLLGEGGERGERKGLSPSNQCSNEVALRR